MRHQSNSKERINRRYRTLVSSPSWFVGGLNCTYAFRVRVIFRPSGSRFWTIDNATKHDGWFCPGYDPGCDHPMKFPPSGCGAPLRNDRIRIRSHFVFVTVRRDTKPSQGGRSISGGASSGTSSTEPMNVIKIAGKEKTYSSSIGAYGRHYERSKTRNQR